MRENDDVDGLVFLPALRLFYTDVRYDPYTKGKVRKIPFYSIQ